MSGHLSGSAGTRGAVSLHIRPAAAGGKLEKRARRGRGATAVHCFWDLEEFCMRLEMMLEPVGGGEPALSAAAVDDFYASDAPGLQALSEAPTPIGNFSADSNGPQLHADQFIPPPPPAESRATVSLGGSPPSAAAAAALSGTLDGRKDSGGAKFAVSQVRRPPFRV